MMICLERDFLIADQQLALMAMVNDVEFVAGRNGWGHSGSVIRGIGVRQSTCTRKNK